MPRPRNLLPPDKLRPRRLPRQQRSRVIYDLILEVAQRMFERDGYAYVSTNRIAEEANISIGSVYQYFPNCEAIALAIYERAASKAALEIKRSAFATLGADLLKTTPEIVRLVFDIFEANNYVLFRMLDEVPELRGANQIYSFERFIHHSVLAYFEQALEGLDHEEIARKSFFIEKCVIGMISHYLQERPDYIDRAQAILEISNVVVGYLKAIHMLEKHAPSPTVAR